MTYIFSGILSDQKIETSIPEDSEELVFREIKHAQFGSGVLFPNQAEDQIDRPNESTFDLVNRLKKYGISEGFWIYYSCWGGDLECVATAKLSNSQIDMNSYSLAENMSYEDLPQLFKKFGFQIERGGNFEPFIRNYWGKHGY